MSVQATYAYRARDAAGKTVSGSMVAASAEEVGARLRAEGKYVLAVDDNALRAEAQLDTQQILRNEAAKRVRRDDVIAFCQQLSVMLDAGVPLTEALDAFCRQTTRKEFRHVLDILRDDVCSGEPFSVAMARWPRVFPTMVVSLMRASEASGNMALMLGRIGNYLAKERRTARQIKGALSYPMFMIVAGLAMTVFLMTFVLPKFAKIYEDRAASLPAPTRVLLAMSDFVLQDYLVYGPILLVGLVGGTIFFRARPGRRLIDWVRLRAPILRVVYGQLYVTRTARTMSTLLGSGVSLLDVIDICRGVTSNSYYDDFWRRMEDDVRAGKQMSDTINASSLLPPNVASMIASGERSGRLPEVMARIAEFAEEEMDAAVKQVTSLIEPIMIVIMGLAVGGIAMALLLPVFTMGKVMAS